jgi:hypothetical protein
MKNLLECSHVIACSYASLKPKECPSFLEVPDLYAAESGARSGGKFVHSVGVNVHSATAILNKIIADWRMKQYKQ